MADTNNTSGTGSAVAEAVSGFAEGFDKAADKQRDVDKAKAEFNEAASTEQSSLEAYVQNVSKLGYAVKQYKYTADQAKAEAGEHDMEKTVRNTVSNGGAVSVSDVLELMEKEKLAKAKAKEEAGRYAKAAMSYAGETVFTGIGVALDGLASGAKDSMKSTSGLVALAGGAAAGLVLGDGVTQDFVTGVVENYAQLKADVELADGVEEKTVDGLEDASAVADYAASVENGVPSDPYGEENGSEYTGEDKTFTSGGERQDIAKDEDALSAPTGSINLDEIVNKVLDGTADPGVAGTPEPAAGGLLSSIAESDLVHAIAETAVETVAPERTALAQQVIDMAEKSDQEAGPEQSGVAAPDLSQFA